MADFFSFDNISTVPVVYHKVGELVSVVVDGSYTYAPKLTVLNATTGKYFNKQTKLFENFTQASEDLGYYTFTLNDLYNTGFYRLNLSTLPAERQKLLFLYKTVSVYEESISAMSEAESASDASEVFSVNIANSGNYEIEFSLASSSSDSVSNVIVVKNDVTVGSATATSVKNFRFNIPRVSSSDSVSLLFWGNDGTISNIKINRVSGEYHVFGLQDNASQPQLCTIFGTILDVSGRPMSGQKVDIYLNKSGYFVHKAGLIGYAASAISDESGYWEIPVIIGLDVTVSIPVIGFSQSGFVPALTSVELTPETLLKFRNN